MLPIWKLVFFGLIIAASIFTLHSVFADIGNKKWLGTTPDHCGTNPWQKYWYTTHNKTYSDYPISDDASIISNYYKKLGVTIFNMTTVSWENGHGTIPELCNHGITLYLLVSDHDVDKMLQLGFFVADDIHKSIMNGIYPKTSDIMSPLDQFKSGISATDVKCKSGLVLIKKLSDNSPACVTSKTAIRLTERGWTNSILLVQ